MASWIEAFDMTGRVGWDQGRKVWGAYHVESGRPQYAVIDRDFMVVEITRSYDDAKAAALEALAE